MLGSYLQTSPKAVFLIAAFVTDLASLVVSSAARADCKTCVVARIGAGAQTPDGVTSQSTSKIAIEDPGNELVVGELYFAVDQNGRQTAILAITEAGSASLIKGTVTPGEALSLRTPSKPRKLSVKEETADPAAPGKKWRFGLGVSFFTLRGIGSIDGSSVSPGTNIMLSAGIYYEFKPSLRSRLSVGLQYYQGGVSSGSASGSGISESLTLNYLGLPLTYKYIFYRGTEANWLVKGGPMISQLLSSKFQIGDDQVSLNKSNVVTAATDFLLTAGVEFITLPSGWWFDLNFDYGFVNIGGPATDSSTMYNAGGIFMLGKAF